MKLTKEVASSFLSSSSSTGGHTDVDMLITELKLYKAELTVDVSGRR